MFLDPDIKMFCLFDAAAWMEEGLWQNVLFSCACLNEVSLAMRQGYIEPSTRTLDPGF